MKRLAQAPYGRSSKNRARLPPPWGKRAGLRGGFKMGPYRRYQETPPIRPGAALRVGGSKPAAANWWAFFCPPPPGPQKPFLCLVLFVTPRLSSAKKKCRWRARLGACFGPAPAGINLPQEKLRFSIWEENRCFGPRWSSPNRLPQCSSPSCCSPFRGLGLALVVRHRRPGWNQQPARNGLLFAVLASVFFAAASASIRLRLLLRTPVGKRSGQRWETLGICRMAGHPVSLGHAHF